MILSGWCLRRTNQLYCTVCDAVRSGTSLPTYGKNFLSLSSGEESSSAVRIAASG
jgi:hypothetical protein